MATQEQERDVRLATNLMIEKGEVYRDDQGQLWHRSDPNFKGLDWAIPSTAALILKDVQKVGSEPLASALADIGPNCFWDDLKSPDEKKGALKLLHWIYNTTAWEAYGK